MRPKGQDYCGDARKSSGVRKGHRPGRLLGNRGHNRNWSRMRACYKRMTTKRARRWEVEDDEVLGNWRHWVEWTRKDAAHF